MHCILLVFFKMHFVLNGVYSRVLRSGPFLEKSAPHDRKEWTTTPRDMNNIFLNKIMHVFTILNCMFSICIFLMCSALHGLERHNNNEQHMHPASNSARPRLGHHRVEKDGQPKWSTFYFKGNIWNCTKPKTSSWVRSISFFYVSPSLQKQEN